MRLRTLGLAVTILLCGAAAYATGATAVRAVAAPRIDGSLEESWKQARVTGSFVQVEPAFSAAATAGTDVYLMVDEQYLYVGIRADQPRASIHASNARRDSSAVWDGDYVSVAIDPQASGNAAYFVVVNPANSIIDGILDTSGSWSRDWDARLVSAAAIDESGWSAEVAIPLAAIGLDAASSRGFGFLAIRYFAEKQEKSLNEIGDRNAVLRIDKFARIRATGGSPTARAAGSLVPYGFARWQSDGRVNASSGEKGGADFRYLPRPSLTVLATVNPDFAQIESDEQIINVSDVPTAYPEKRPFFTESSDLYPGLAVNTRNIGTIRAGLKMRQVLPSLRYDVTTLLDDQHNRWLLGDARWTDNHSYHVEVIGGVKDAPDRRDYNVTTNLRTWFLDKRLTAYTWFGTINSQVSRGNEWESVNAVRWDTRRFRAGIWNHFKSELYNPNIVGFDALSNETIVKGWVSGSYFSDTGRVREVTPELDIERFDLFTSPGHEWYRATAMVSAVVRPDDHTGVWRATAAWVPPLRQLFRYRHPDSVPAMRRYRDAYSEFALVEQKHQGLRIEVSSDPSKTFAVKAVHEQGVVRGSGSRETSMEGKWRVLRSSTLSLGVDRVAIGSSPYQSPWIQTIGRIRVEHTFARDVNVRALYQSNTTDAETRTKLPALNLVVSWPVDPKTTLYLVVNENRLQTDGPVASPPPVTTRNVAFKVSHALSF